MKPILFQIDDNSKEPIYIQLYNYIKRAIATGDIGVGERLPSLRGLATDLGISLTTVSSAYNQLAVEGYIENRPQSGYYAAGTIDELWGTAQSSSQLEPEPRWEQKDSPFLYDLSCFDFVKWKKCASTVLTEYPHHLLFESDPQGEYILRQEIASYLAAKRGVSAKPEQIVISAGTQQTTSHLTRILSKLDISTVSVETPGYLPVQRIFADDGFLINHIPVDKDGIRIDALPTNISSAVYVSPSNQFPTGSVMPVGQRYKLIQWAERNNSFVIEDDYDSELRYFGKPIAALQGLDQWGRVIYLGSFSSTLFPAIKISYMVLPPQLDAIFQSIKKEYSQTCSKAEQLTLALFMQRGYYSLGIKKMRKLYSQKLQKALSTIASYSEGMIIPLNTYSGINMIIRVKYKRPAKELCALAEEIGVQVMPVSSVTDQDTTSLTFYYNQIPLDRIEDKIKELILKWQ